MANSEIFPFRPRKAVEGDWQMIKRWCEDPKIKMPVSAIFNSFIPAIAYALHNNCFRAEDGSIFIRCDFGDIKICKRDN